MKKIYTIGQQRSLDIRMLSPYQEDPPAPSQTHRQDVGSFRASIDDCELHRSRNTGPASDIRVSRQSLPAMGAHTISVAPFQNE
jgi:hypothetical protein